MRYTLVAGLIALLPLSTISAQPASHAMRQTSTSALAKPTGRPVARVNGTVLTDRDLLREMFAIFPYARQHNGGFPQAMEANIRSGAMKMMEFEELVYQEAQRRKMTVSAARMSRALADFRKQFPTDQAFQEFLKTDLNGSLDVLRARVERSLLIDQVLKTEVSDKAGISAAQLKEYYDKNSDRFKTPESLTFQTISILAPDKATPAQLKDVRKKAEDALKEGQTSELIQIGPSFCVLRLNAHTAAGKQTFEMVKKSLREELERSKTESLRSGLDKKLRAGAKIEEL